jgi:two-component system, cell cycle sensor histidine kinase and response regulator CckA
VSATRIAAALHKTEMNLESAGSPGAGRVILVVDDEPAERELIRGMLEAAGYEVIEAGDGKEAESVLAACEVDLIITDIVMPEQEGLQTIRWVRKNRPGLKIVAISGSGGPHLHAAELMGANAVLRKPLTSDVLLQVVIRQTGGPRA